MFNFLKSKTIWTGASVALLGLLEAFKITDFAAFIPDNLEPLVVSGIGFLIVVLRLMTTQPISEK